MKIYDESKTKLLDNPDLSLGYLTDGEITIHHEAEEGVVEEGHWETLAEYPNGGKEIKWVVDRPGVPPKPARDESEIVRIYVPYTEAQLKERRVAELKKLLADTDYRAIKYAEGELTAEEYAETRADRRAWRAEVNELEAELTKAAE